ncbi:hypothetical protein B0O99DRAFT_703595 [Bisporella sp. PMI_857]|nr:hypothetical protein B0O99DRAFT_703595 [Bisporella sp. PMI_857]
MWSFEKHVAHAIKPVSLTNGNPLGPQSMSWVNSLLSECLHHHEDCPSIGEDRLPFRILALEAPLDGHPIVRLEENETKYGRYATLSHRWGSQQSCTTTLSTLKTRQIHIP